MLRELVWVVSLWAFEERCLCDMVCRSAEYAA